MPRVEHTVTMYILQNAQHCSSAGSASFVCPILTYPYQCSPRPPNEFLKIHFHISLPSTPSQSKLSLSLKFPNQTLPCTCLWPHTCHMPCPSRFSWFDHAKSTWCRVPTVKLLTLQYPTLPCHRDPVRQKYFPWLLIVETPFPTFSPKCNRTRLHVNFLRLGLVNITSNPQAGRLRLVGCQRLLIQYYRIYSSYLNAISSTRNGTARYVMVTVTNFSRNFPNILLKIFLCSTKLRVTASHPPKNLTYQKLGDILKDVIYNIETTHHFRDIWNLCQKITPFKI
jgi:hypothetical protein